MSIIDWIVRSSADVWHQEWIVKKKKKRGGKSKTNTSNNTTERTIEKLYRRWKYTANFLFYSMKKKKQREKAFIQFDQPESRACLQCHSSSSSEIDIVSKTSITICV